MEEVAERILHGIAMRVAWTAHLSVGGLSSKSAIESEACSMFIGASDKRITYDLCCRKAERDTVAAIAQSKIRMCRRFERPDVGQTVACPPKYARPRALGLNPDPHELADSPTQSTSLYRNQLIRGARVNQLLIFSTNQCSLIARRSQIQIRPRGLPNQATL